MQEQLWVKIESLIGRTLVTVEGAKFKVIDVTEMTVLIEVDSTHRHVRLYRGEIERAAVVGNWRTVRSGMLRNAGVKGAAGYIAGLLRAIA